LCQAPILSSAFENKRRYNAYSVIPTEVEESLTISVVESQSALKYSEMSPVRLAALAQGKLTEWRLRRT